jgi:hypothetical protein
MEEPQKITQEIPDETLDKTSSHAETNFGDETFDGTPIKRGRFGGFNEWIFSLMRPKSKVPAKSQRKIPPQAVHKAPCEDQNVSTQINGEPPIYVATKENIPERLRRVPDDSTAIYDPANNVEIGHVFHNGRGILLKKKTLAERVRDQIRFPVPMQAGQSELPSLSDAIQPR